MKYFLLSFGILFQITLKSQSYSGIQVKNMDKQISPGSDFYGFCNGGWQSTFVLPESDARYGSFNEIHNNNLKRIKTILDAIAVNYTALPKSDMQRMRDFYNSGMDSAKLNNERWQPIRPLMDKIDSIKSLQDFMKIKSEFDYLGIPLLFNCGVSPDLKNSKRNRLYLYQGGYGLGDRDYYHLPKHEKIRAQYLNYLHDLFVLVRFDEEAAKNASEEVLAYEINLSYEALTRTEQRDPEKLYNPFKLAELSKMVPSIDWMTYLKSKKITPPDTVIVSMVNYIKQVEVLASKAPIPILKLYAKAQLMMAAAPYLSMKFQQLDFKFRGNVLSGTKEMKPRWERVFKAMNENMGEMISKEYLKRYFSPEAKAKVNKLIDNLVFAYRQRIATRTWMSPASKAMANKKLDLMIRKIAYPEKWKNYEGLDISNKSYWDNICRARSFEYQDNMHDLRKPVDRKKWQMTPVTVNAYYDPSTNEITFPAAILQPPFYDPKAEDAANYGTMGSIIGHELTHGFDDQGAKFDAYGNLKTWWTESDEKNFEEKSRQMVTQINSYTLLDSLHVNGEMTLGENIADLGGVTLSFQAYKRSLGKLQSKSMDGFSGEQRFFIAWAQGWKSKVRNEELKRLLTMDYHAPAYLRAFAPLRNLKEFYEAFGIKPGDKLYLEENQRIEIW